MSNVNLAGLSQSLKALGVREDELYRVFRDGTVQALKQRELHGTLTTNAQLEWLIRNNIVRYNGEVASLVSGIASVALADIGRQVLALAEGEAMELISLLLQRVKDKSVSRSGMQNLHALIADEAKTKVLEAYSSSPFNSGKRQANKFSGGMLKALESNSFIVATPSGILFANTALLDQVAPHWHRLNYGAGQRGFNTNTLSVIPLRLNGANVGNFIIDVSPSAPFILPRGFFLQGGSKYQPYSAERRGLDQFFLATPSNIAVAKKSSGGRKVTIEPPRLSKGFAGHDFFRPGLEYIASALPLAYVELVKTWVSESSIVK